MKENLLTFALALIFAALAYALFIFQCGAFGACEF